MILVEQCGSWHEMDTGRGKHCFNCVHREGYPQRAQPSKSCANFVRLPTPHARDAAHACCQRCHELSGDQKCQWCRHKRRARNVNRWLDLENNMSDYPNYTLEQLADLILRLDVKEGVSPAGLGALQMFAKSALENASQQSFAPDAAHACCQRCHELSGDQKCQWCRHKRRARNVNR